MSNTAETKAITKEGFFDSLDHAQLNLARTIIDRAEKIRDAEKRLEDMRSQNLDDIHRFMDRRTQWRLRIVSVNGYSTLELDDLLNAPLKLVE